MDDRAAHGGRRHGAVCRVRREVHDRRYAFFVDQGLTTDGATTTSITGLDHLEGEEVAVLADGAVHPNRTVSSGAITLQLAASVVNVGLPYTATIKTMPIEAGAQDGTAQGKEQRINGIVLDLFETGAGLWYGPNTTDMDSMPCAVRVMPWTHPLPLFTGRTDRLAWPGEYEKGTQMVVQHRLLPLHREGAAAAAARL